MRAATLLLLLLPLLARADALQDLVSAGELEISAAIAPASGAVPGQHLSLTVTVATQRWFTGGTRIAIPEVPGLVILQTEQFAANASERRGGTSWVVQRWTLDVYPQRAGDFTLPPLTVSVQVNSTAGNVEGELQTEALAFAVALPAALEDIDSWVAAPRFELEQRLDREPLELVVGDALQRDISFEAEAVQAMMLPGFSPEDIAGLRAYREPPQLDNRNDRGTMRARRQESVIYIAEQPGNYLLPARDFYWWNTYSGELELLQLPAIEVEVTGSAAGSSVASRRAEIDWGRWIDYLLATAVLAVGLWLCWRALPALRRQLQTLLSWWQRARDSYRAWRRPGLPASLNPDSSAGD